MGVPQFFDFSNFDFWQLPFEKNGFFLDVEADKYGIAAAVVREALRREGRQGKRKVRLLKALEGADEAVICREIAGIYRSALKNSKSAKSCEATERSLERNIDLNADNCYLDDLFEKMAALPQVEREVSFFEFYFDNFFLYKKEDWIFVSDKIGVNFARIERIAGIKSPDFGSQKADNGQMAWVFEV